MTPSAETANPAGAGSRAQMFVACCIGFVATAMMFAIRADILGDLSAQFRLTNEQLGWVIIGAFWGLTIAVFIGGQLCDLVGMRALIGLAFTGHLLGVVMTVFANGYVMFAAATLLIGLGDGFLEAVVNPLVATIYPDRKTQKLNGLHAWWPGGVVIGCIVAFALTRAGQGWQIKQAVTLIPTLAYGLMFLRMRLPRTERVQSGVSTKRMYKEALRPLFILLVACMALTAITELGPNQWIAEIMKKTATRSGSLVLAWISFVMLVGRLSAGAAVRKLAPTGLLVASAAASAVGLFAMSRAHSAPTAYAASFVFAAGVCYFWPTMLGVTSERLPAGGAFLLGLIGASGSAAGGLAQPLMGYLYDAFGPAGALRHVALLPVFLTVVFAAIFLCDRMRGGYRAVALGETQPDGSEGNPELPRPDAGAAS